MAWPTRSCDPWKRHNRSQWSSHDHTTNLLSAGAALGALAVRAGRAQSQPSFEEIIRMPVVYTVPGTADVQVREGLVYKTVDGSPLHFDLYAPAARSGASPGVILIHGRPGLALGARRWQIFRSYGRMLAATGMIGIAFDHRLLGLDRYSDSALDVADLVRHVRAEAGTFGIDQMRLALWAFSGGGPLLAAPLRERPSWLKLIVAYYTVMHPFGNDKNETFSTIAALGPDASNAPPIVLARAGLDMFPEINPSIDRFVAAANSADATVDLLMHPTGRHSFDLLDPGDRSRQIIEHTLGALRHSLGV
jgi:acetyl esterase/lipase